MTSKTTKLNMLTVVTAALANTSIMSASKHGKTDTRFYTGSQGNNSNPAIDGSKPNKKRLKVKLARKANVQRLIKMK